MARAQGGFGMSSDETWMREALVEARLAADEGEVPVGAVIVAGDQLVSRGHNRRETDHDPLAHAELLAIRAAAAALGRWRLLDCTLYVTLEPCPMCAGAIVNARICRVVFGAHDPRAGALGSIMDLCRDPRLNHRADVACGVLAEEAGSLLRRFFANRRRPE
jgi:tRNA(adenine34) deaminase